MASRSPMAIPLAANPSAPKSSAVNSATGSGSYDSTAAVGRHSVGVASAGMIRLPEGIASRTNLGHTFRPVNRFHRFNDISVTPGHSGEPPPDRQSLSVAP